MAGEFKLVTWAAMAHHFYFDISDGQHISRMKTGSCWTASEAHAREAIRALPEVARDVLPDGTERVISATVCDKAGTVLFRAVLTFRCEWPQPGDLA
ncbi:MAG: DUF6894 family protein [Geminicoccaceae bacterium]